MAEPFRLCSPRLFQRNNLGGRPLCYSPDGTLLATTTPLRGPVSIWYVQTGELLRTSQQSFQRGVFLPDGARFVTSCDGQLAIWDFHRDEVELLEKFTHQGNVDVADIQCSASGQLVAVVASDVLDPYRHVEFCEVWDLKTRALKMRFVDEESVNLGAVALSSDGSLCAVAGNEPAKRAYPGAGDEIDHCVVLSDEGKVLWRRPDEETRSPAIWSLGFLPSDNSLWTADFGGSISFWNVQTGELTSRMQEPTTRSDGSELTISSSVYVPEENLLLNGGMRFQIIDTAYIVTESMEILLPPSADILREFRKRYNRFGYLSVWDLQEKRILGQYLLPGHYVRDVVVSPDAQQLSVSVGQENLVFDLEF